MSNVNYFFFQTDFSELVYVTGKAHLIALVDHATKVVPGWAVNARPVTVVALQAWQRAKATLLRSGWPVTGIIVRHDQDPVFTGDGWLRRLLIEDRVRLSYAVNGARDYPEMGSFFSRFKNENRSLFQDAETLPDLIAVVARRIHYYNQERRHSAIRLP